ncbi:MAG: winged helix-turn-helix domain-containing protein [Candidatus Nitrosotenuis sp.]
MGKANAKQILKTGHKAVLEIGPLESVFPGSTSKILDFLATFKAWDYSVSDIAKNSGLSFKTALNDIKNLEAQDVVVKTRTVGKATMYRLNLESKQGHYVDKLIFEIATKRINDTINSIQEKTGRNRHKKQRTS